MAFTYNLTESPTIGRVRLNIGDTVENSGVLPEGRNFQDDEINLFLQDEENHPQRATAAALEALAAAWSARAGRYRLGPESEDSRQAESFRKQAVELRQAHGYTIDPNATSAAGFGIPTKVK